MGRYIIGAILLGLLWVAVGGGYAKERPADGGFIHRQGRQLLDGSGRPIMLRGVCFGNDVWTNPAYPPTTHHSEKDYKRLRDLNMNVVRFYLNYGLFETDDAPGVYRSGGWDWLDKNIQWAKKHGIYLILNMHVPQGGFQSLGEGTRLWTEAENRRRLIDLWQAIAARYRDETIIAGYDLLNEPITPKSIDEWKDLAVELLQAIRSVDNNHLIIVERLNGVKGQWVTYGEPNHFLLPDDNYMLTFHFYSPMRYTHQNTSWTGLGDGGSYPDANRVEVTGILDWATATFNNPAVPQGSSDWRYYEGEKVRVMDPGIIAGKPALVCANNRGTVFYDDIVVKEYDENGEFLREIYKSNITSKDGWAMWSANGSGIFELSTREGHEDRRSLSIGGTTDDANCYNDDLRFAVVTGRYYSISGWMKGKGVTRAGTCRIRIDFEKGKPGATLHFRNKDYLEAEITRFLAFAEANNLPIFLGEFGVNKDCFREGKGGLIWVRDMLDLLKKHQLHYTYHAYHDGAFGFYTHMGILPDSASANRKLLELFREF